MTKRLIVLAAVAMLALPAAALGSTTPAQAASASCKAQLKAVGSSNFYSSAMYKSFGACVSKASHLTAAQRQSLLSAEKQCRSAQRADSNAFDLKYGTNAKTGKHATAPTSGTAENAFGKCVSALNHA